MNEPNIELGDLVKDDITGFSGVVTSITHWFNGCRRIGVQPRTLSEKGGMHMAETFDENQLAIVEKRAVTPRTLSEAPSKKTGGPRPVPVGWTTPERP